MHVRRKKSRRICIVLILVASLTGAGVWFYNRHLGENPDYIHAAGELPAARAEAEKLFGPLTWSEYYAKKNISTKNDTEKWKQIVSSVPPEADQFYRGEADGSITCRQLFTRNKSWFLGLRERITGLSHSRDEHGWLRPRGFETSKLVSAVSVGIVGAADAGDVKSVTYLTHVGWDIVISQSREPDPIAILHYTRTRTRIDLALIKGLIRNRSSGELFQAVCSALDARPDLPPLIKVYEGETRSFEMGFDDYRASSLEKLIHDVGGYESTDSKVPASPGSSSSIVEKLQNLIEDIKGDEPKNPKRIGLHTLDAFEARLLQTNVAFARASKIENSSECLSRFKQIIDSIQQKKDLSYEWIQGPFLGHEVVNQVRSLFVELATRTAIEMIDRFPDFPDLPSALPSGLVFDDPFGGGEVIYKKTGTGFVLYTRYEDLRDDGFVPDPGVDFSTNDAAFLRGKDWSDYGLVVNYLPTKPIL